MRTTGIRSAPNPAPRRAPGAGDPPQPLPRTKFPISTAHLDSPRERLSSSTDVLPQDSNKLSSGTQNVISDHSSLRSRLSKRNEGNVLMQDVNEGTGDLQSSVSSSPTKCKSPVNSPRPEDNSPVVSPPPKPPRTYQYRQNPSQEKHGDSRQSLSTKDTKLSNGSKSRNIPARPKTMRKPGSISVAASDMNDSASQQRTTTVVGERTPVQETIASPTLQVPSSTAPVSSIVSSVQTYSKESIVSSPTKKNSSDDPNDPRPKSAWRVAAQRLRDRRFPALSLSSPNVASVPPRLSARPLLPSRPTTAQVAASLARSGVPRPQRTGNGAAESFPRSPTAATFLRTASKISVVDQDSVCTAADFEDNCRRVFRHTRVAEEHMGKDRHIQAASEYQGALKAIDRVLRTQVLGITSDEPTRQRFFHMQQEVFYTRKEALNGFSDAQTAITTPRELASSRQPQGAPPSYDDVIREDLSKSQDLLSLPCSEGPTSLPARKPTTRGLTAQRPGRRQDLRLPPTGSLAPQESSGHRPSRTFRARSSSLSGRATGMVLVDVLGESDSGASTPHTAPVTCIFQPLVPIRATVPRAKSSYLPGPITPALAKQPNEPATQPTPSQPGQTQEPQPRSAHGHGETTNLDTQSSSYTNETPSPQDEAVVHQALALQRFQEKQRDKSIATDEDQKMEKTITALKNIVASPPKPRRLYSSPGAPGSGPRKGVADNESSTSVRQPIMSLSGSLCTSNLHSVHNQTRTPTVPSTSSVIDPFMTLDPFPSVGPIDVNTDDVFYDRGQPSSLAPSSSVYSDDNDESVSTKKDSLQMPAKSTLATNVVPETVDACVDGAAVPEVVEVGQAPEGSPASDHITSDDLGDSILDALDFAVSQTPGQRRAFSHQSKGTIVSRCHSEETLLDYSYRTLERYLDSRKALCASRASIIEEFDPLVSLAPADEDHKLNSEESSVAVEDVPCGYCTEPKAVKSKLEDGKRDEPKEVPSAQSWGEEGRYRDLTDTTAEASGWHADPPGTNEATIPNHVYNESGASVSSSESCLSWPPDYSRNTSCPYPRLTPLSADAEGVDPWLAQNPENKASKSQATAVDIGRSAFYTPTHRKQGGLDSGKSDSRKAVAVSSIFRDLLRIREGVKLFFIYEDGVVISPWNHPFLAVSKDPNKAWLVGEGLLLRVGDDMWSCQLHSKSTLVMRTLSGVYIFGDVAGKPECKAVGVRVPSAVRQVQHELLGRILRENTLLEDERPVGITKAISKSASSAATRMNQYVDDKSMSTNRAFVRKNSIRALKGMSKRLNNLAERTGSNLKELPAEYKKLQEAAETLRSSRNAKTIQYI